MTTPIVCGVDRSAAARAAADLAAALAERFGRPLLLVHAASWPSVDVQTRRTTLGIALATSDTLRRHERWLDAFASELAVSRVQTRVEVGPAADWIAATAAEYAAALVVVGCRGVGALRSLALGSVSADLTRRAPCPVAIVPAQVAATRGDPLAGERIVCGVGDPKDVAVADLAGRFAESLGLRLALVDTGEQLAALAATEQTALVVVGSRGRGPLRSGVLGSAPWRLASIAGCPVVVCRHGDRPSPGLDRMLEGSPARDRRPHPSLLAGDRPPHQ